MFSHPTSQKPTTSQPTMMPSTPKPSSYANVTSSTCFPKKDQAIILDSIDGITLKEYLVALSAITPAANIRFISRISNARICIYLDSKKTADNLIDKKVKVNIKSNALEIKPLITRNKRIVLSNVCPVIPNHIIEQKFEELRIKIMSPITFMKIGVSDPGFSHILSFRRQLFISPEDEIHLPESFQVTFEGTNYWIYTSTDALKCFSCNSLGHLAKNCTQNEQNLEKETDNEITESFNELQGFSLPTPLKGKKRIHSPTITESSKTGINEELQNDESDKMEFETDETGSNISIEDNVDINKKTQKKLKKTDTRTNEEIWDNIRENMTDLIKENSFPINLDQFISLLENSSGKQNVRELVFSYTDNVKDLIKMCNKLHSKMNKSLKNRCSRLSRKLHELLNPNPILMSDRDE